MKGSQSANCMNEKEREFIHFSNSIRSKSEFLFSYQMWICLSSAEIGRRRACLSVRLMWNKWNAKWKNVILVCCWSGHSWSLVNSRFYEIWEIPHCLDCHGKYCSSTTTVMFWSYKFWLICANKSLLATDGWMDYLANKI